MNSTRKQLNSQNRWICKTYIEHMLVSQTKRLNQTDTLIFSTGRAVADDNSTPYNAINASFEDFCFDHGRARWLPQTYRSHRSQYDCFNQYPKSSRKISTFFQKQTWIECWNSLWKGKQNLRSSAEQRRWEFSLRLRLRLPNFSSSHLHFPFLYFYLKNWQDFYQVDLFYENTFLLSFFLR